MSAIGRASRVILMAEMHGRDLLRRRGALGLLVALPLSFYLTSAGRDTRAPVTGGIGMSFAVSGAALFSIMSARAVDQRLVLGGYRPIELLLGRLGFLGPLAITLAAAFTCLMAGLSGPARIWVVGFGLALVALQAVAFGLAIGAAVPRELEGTLALIGVIGVQLSTDSSSIIAKALPFYGPKRVIEAGVGMHGPILIPAVITLAYCVGLLIASRLMISRRVFVRRHPRTGRDDVSGGERLVLSGVNKHYGATTILDQVDLTIRAGEVVALTGENGAGKSTLMRICAGVLPADGGTVRATRPIGYCPQEAGLFDLLTADEHLVMFGRGAGMSRVEALRHGHDVLAEFGFPSGQNDVVKDLSGGTRQKLNLAIALLCDPALLLLDEPYQGFDRGMYVNFWDHCRVWRERGIAVVVVTHMLAELDRVDRVVELPAHPSRIHHRSARPLVLTAP